MTDILKDVEKLEARKQLVLFAMKSFVISLFLLLLDTVIIWYVYDRVLVMELHAPWLSKWDMLGLLIAYRTLTHRGKK